MHSESNRCEQFSPNTLILKKHATKIFVRSSYPAVFTGCANSQFGAGACDKNPNHVGQRAEAFSIRSIEMMATHSLLRFS